MPKVGKRKQKSKDLGKSIDDVKTKSKDLRKTVENIGDGPKKSKGLRKTLDNIGDGKKTLQNESSEKLEETSELRSSDISDYDHINESPERIERLPITRTQLFLEEYKQFKAARIIQKYFLAWYLRRKYLRKRSAAITIQRFWRGFYSRSSFVKYLENLLQERIVKHYNVMATRIQAFWRGWYVRLHVHDHYRLKRQQMRDAKELLYCVAYKMHYLIRTRQIPGVYSLHNTVAYSKIEKLLKALRFMDINCHSELDVIHIEKDIHEKRKDCQESYRRKGKDCQDSYRSVICDPKCQALSQKKDADERMHRILQHYRDFMKTDPRVIEYEIRKGIRKTPRPKKEPPKPDFCEDVVQSISQWRILTPRTIEINPNVMKSPDLLNGFLTEVRSICDRMTTTPCVCFPPISLNLMTE